MKWGCCGPLDPAVMRAVGFDYQEFNAMLVLRGDQPTVEWEATAPDPKSFPLPTPATNGLVPPTLACVGPQRDMVKLQDYVQRVTQRAQRYGVKLMVFGSGKSRQCPPEMGLGAATDQIVEFGRMAAEVAAHYGITIALEHLCQRETNTVNKLAQARDVARRVNHPNFRLLVDSYHFGVEHETDLALLSLEGMVAHVHVAEPVDRIQPGAHPADSGKRFDFVHFFRLLRRIGYDGTISVEAPKWTPSLEQGGPACLAYLHECWDKAKK